MRHRTLTVWMLLVVAGSAPSSALPPGASGIDDSVRSYVRSVGGEVSKDPLVRFDVFRDPVPNAYADAGRYEVAVSTGLLAALEDEAELAFVLAHEAAHLRASKRERKGGSGLGRRIATSAAVGAASAVVGTAVAEAVDDSHRYVRAAAVGAAVGATGAAVYAAMNGWGRKGEVRAVKEGVRAACAAGYDGHAALSSLDSVREAYDRRSRGVEAFYGAFVADARYRKAAAKAARRCRGRTDSQTYRRNLRSVFLLNASDEEALGETTSAAHSRDRAAAAVSGDAATPGSR